MSNRCSYGCPPGKRSKVSHRFPNPNKYPQAFEDWLKHIPNVQKENLDISKLRVCDRHFEECDKYPVTKRILRGAVPKLFLPGQESTHLPSEDSAPIDLPDSSIDEYCDCDWHYGTAASTENTQLQYFEIIRNTVDDEHNYTPAILEDGKSTSRKRMPALKKHRTIDCVQSTVNESTTVKLLNGRDDFGKIREPPQIEDANLINAFAIEETPIDVSDDPQPQAVQTDADDVVTVETTPNETVPNTEAIKSKLQDQNIPDTNFNRRSYDSDQAQAFGNDVTYNTSNAGTKKKIKLLHDSTGEENVSKLQKKETNVICVLYTSSDELFTSDNECLNDATDRREIDVPGTGDADIAELETEKTSHAQDKSLPVIMYNDESSTSSSRPVSPIRPKLEDELLEYGAVGSTTIVSEFYEPQEIQPLEDPLAIHSPDTGVNYSIEPNEYAMDFEEGSIATMDDSMSIAEDHVSTVEENLSTVEDNQSIFEDNLSIFEDNASMDNYSSRLGNRIESNSKKRMALEHEQENEYEMDPSILNCGEDIDSRIEMACALKFIYKKGKTATAALKEMISVYGPDKMSLKEAVCWYNEFGLGNNVLKIIFSGGPIYK